MADDAKRKDRAEAGRDEFAGRVGSKEKRKIRGRADRDRSPWFWAGMFGLVGWTVALPTAIGVYVGVLLDRRFPESRLSWTLACLILGVAFGCANAWYWVNRESRRED
jgi:ATP synthase protein I